MDDIVNKLREEVKKMLVYINRHSKNQDENPDNFSWSLFKLDVENNWNRIIKEIEEMKTEM